MPTIGPFEKYAARYEEWFDKNPFVYDAELRAVKQALPPNGNGVEIGVGSGRFAAPLGIRSGVEPSRAMSALARARGIDVREGSGERLPVEDGSFDFAVFITTICFLDDVEGAFREAYRILKENGLIIIGFVEKHSRLGAAYEEKKAGSDFYREAVFYSREEVVSSLKAAGFLSFLYYQTLFKPLELITAEEPVRAGFGEGSFLVIKGLK